MNYERKIKANFIYISVFPNNGCNGSIIVLHALCELIDRMKTRWINKIPLDKKHLPYKWTENLISNGKIGGVMLVFIEGFTETEINNKVKAIKDFCKELKKSEDLNIEK